MGSGPTCRECGALLGTDAPWSYDTATGEASHDAPRACLGFVGKMIADLRARLADAERALADAQANHMDAPGGPRCACGLPSALEDGACARCAELAEMRERATAAETTIRKCAAMFNGPGVEVCIEDVCAWLEGRSAEDPVHKVLRERAERLESRLASILSHFAWAWRAALLRCEDSPAGRDMRDVLEALGEGRPMEDWRRAISAPIQIASALDIEGGVQRPTSKLAEMRALREVERVGRKYVDDEDGDAVSYAQRFSSAMTDALRALDAVRGGKAGAQ